MTDFEAVRTQFLNELNSVRSEAAIVLEELVLPNWGSRDRHGFPRTLYGYVMSAMALLDVLACYCSGGKGDQTKAMEDVLVESGAQRATANLAVRLWRHYLMHNGAPQPLTRMANGVEVNWVLHWADHLPRDQHMTFTPDWPNLQTLCVSLFYLFDDIEQAAGRCFDRCERDPTAATRLRRAEAQLARRRELPGSA